MYLTPAQRPTLAEAQAWCKQLATTHYENFHVATFFLPNALRPHFHSVYAFCRTSDDLGDEVADTRTGHPAARRSGARMLAPVLRRTRAVAPSRLRCAAADDREPAICRIEPFDDLISAFSRTRSTRITTSLATLEHYSRYSANPVGRLVLMVCGYRDDELLQLSDEICTGLQLANFYQDIVEDCDTQPPLHSRRIHAALRRHRRADSQAALRRQLPRHDASSSSTDARARLNARQRASSTLVDPDLAATLVALRQGRRRHPRCHRRAGLRHPSRLAPWSPKRKKLRLLGGALAGKLAALLLPDAHGERA